MKKLWLLVVALFMGSGLMEAQTTDMVVNELNKSGFWNPYVRWLQRDDTMEGYLRNLGDNSVDKMKMTLRALDEDHRRAQELLNARDEIVGKNESKRQRKKDGRTDDERLASRFKDVEAAKRVFEKAEQVEHRYEILKNAINQELEQRKPAVMPAGKLQYFSYSTSNAFGGFSEEITLDGQKGKHELKVEARRMNVAPEEEEKPVVPKEVNDSVFQRVREMVEQGRLYEVGRHYMPDYDILDASNWSLYIVFEQGSIGSGGYAEGPDHHDTLHAIINYLTKIFKGE